MSQANEIFNEKVFKFLNKEELYNEYKETDISNDVLDKLVSTSTEMNNKKYDVISAYKDVNGYIQTTVSEINTDEEMEFIYYIDSFYHSSKHTHMNQNSLFRKNYVKAESTPVWSYPNHSSLTYIGGKLVASVNTDFLLEQHLTETDYDYDYFYLRLKHEFETFNGADPLIMEINLDLPKAESPITPRDNLTDWDPEDTSNEQSFTVDLSFPITVSWNFTTIDDVNVNFSGGQSSDYANWVITEARTLSSYLHNPERFEPGIDWLSSESIAQISFWSTAWFDYNYQTYDIDSSYWIEYDYPAPIR